GGGGTLRAAKSGIDQVKPKESIELISVDQIPEDGNLTLACGFLASQVKVENDKDFSDLLGVLKEFSQIAKSETKANIARLVPIELGVQSCVVPVCMAALKLNAEEGWNLKVVDADGASRAVPLLAATTFASASASGRISPFPALFGGTIKVQPDRP